MQNICVFLKLFGVSGVCDCKMFFCKNDLKFALLKFLLN